MASTSRSPLEVKTRNKKMGANSSSISELSSNDYLLRLSGKECISSNDPFWNQLLSFSFQVPRNSADQRLLEESTAPVCKNFAINNCSTGNFSSLITVFLTRATELKSSAQCQDEVFTWQTYNALFIIRNVCKYFVENLSEAVVVQQFDTRPPGNGDEGFVIVDKQETEDKASFLEELINSVIEILVDVPILDFTYALHLECQNTLLTLLAIQMYQPTPASESFVYRSLMQGKCSIHACVLMKTLLHNYMKQQRCPPSLSPSGTGHGGLYNFTSAMASGLWSVMTLGMAKKDKDDQGPPDQLLANQSLLLILVLVNTCTNEQVIHNPYREALFSFTNKDSDSSPTQTVATFKLDLSVLYKVMCDTLKDDQVTLLLYLLLHRNSEMKSFILSRTNIDQLIIPILKILYAAQEKNSHHIYMALIILLILSEDEDFNREIHETQLKNIMWFKERHITEISLGGILILVLIRTIQYNMTRMKDKYLHTNCLAALANMSAYFKHLHPYVAQRLVSLFALLLKKHSRLIEQISTAASSMGNTGSNESGSGSESGHDNDQVEDLAILEEVIRMVLEIINSCLTHSLPHNPNLVYTLLYQRDLFTYFRTHPTFQDIIQNIDTVLSYFTQKLEVAGKQHTVHEVQAMVNQGVQQFHRDKLKKFPELKFKYVEEDQPEEFFVPYVWSLAYYSANLYFNSSRIQIFSIHMAGNEAGKEEEGT